MAIGKQKGSAVWETIPLLSLIFAIIGGILFAAYLLFGKAYVNYHAEQALYCVSEGTSIRLCRRQLMRQVERHLPWGRLQVRELNGGKDGARIHARWSFEEIHMNVRREMKDFSRSRSSR